jgi:multiple sugar transport system permease protein
LIRIGIINEPILWTKDPEYILWVVIIISVWMSMGTGFLVFLAGLQSIPKFLYEAAAIDGVKNRFMELWHITLPMMKPQLLFGAINSIVGAFGVFDIAVSVAGIPSPNYAAHTIVTHLYDYAFIRFQMGYASAVAVFLFLLTFYLGRISMKIFSSE